MTRTLSIKNMDEVYFSGVINPSGVTTHFAQLVVTAAAGLTIRTDADGYSSGNTGSLVVFPKYGTKPHGTPVIQVGGGTGDTLTFTGGTAPNQGQIQLTPEASGTYFSVTGGVAGDVFEVYTIPTYTSSDQINWIDDFSGPAVPGKRNVMEKGVAKFKKRIFNTEKTWTATQRYANSTVDLLKYAGNDFTLIAERQDDDGGVTTETLFVFDAYHDAGLPTGSVGDNDSSVSLDGTYRDFCFIDGDGN